MKTKLRLLAVALIAGGTMFAQPRVAIGIGVGGYGPGAYPPPAYAQSYVPPCPGPGYAWVDGYWAPQGGRNVWIAGFWRAPRVAPGYVAPRYYSGYRGNDHDRDRGRNEHFENRGRSFGNGFRR
jgi:WXXGXW repeat (2 copies)